MVTIANPEGRGAPVARAGHGSSRGLRALLLSLLVLLCAGCQLVAGDFKVSPTESSTSGSMACPGGGSYRCNGEYLLTCGGKDAGWVLKQTCGSADLCDSKGKQCRVCKPGDLRCDGQSREECSQDGKSWREVEKCESAAICNPTFCGNCKPGEFSCRGESSSVGSVLSKCGTEGTWSIELGDCGSDGLCMASLDASRASSTWNEKCMPGACDAGTYSCDGTTLRHCLQDQTGWEVVDTCATKELCALAVDNSTTTTGVIDMCPTGCGTAGAWYCDGMTLEKCRDDLTGRDAVMTCGSDTECNPMLGACADLCTPGDYQCNDKTLRRCNTTRHWDDVQVCASAPLCQATTGPTPSGQCLAPACPAVGAYSCDGVTLSKCRDDLMGWEMVDTCASAALCSASDKRCNDAACDTDELRCFDAEGGKSELRKCKPDRTGWDLVATCDAGQLCSNDPADSGCKMSCPSPTRCNGSELERCTGNGWVHQATCATNDLCSCTLDNTCELGSGKDGCGVVVCGGTLATYQCQGSELEKCAAGRNGWIGQSDCGQASLCYPGAAPTYQDGYCAVCPMAGELRCASGTPNATLTQCSPDRTMWSTVQTCNSNGCIDSGTADYCAACAPTQVMCSGPTLQKCASDQRNYVNTTCQSSALCDAAHGQCDVCTPPNSNTCSSKTLQHCSSDGQSIQSQTCPNYCDASGGQCDSCVASTSRCSNNVLYTCASDGQSEKPTTCATAALCNSAKNQCDKPTCNPGDHRCASTQPQVCNANQNGWDSTGNACATAALCNMATGTCSAPACAVGELRCNGAQPQVCNSDRTGFVNSGSACATAALCGATTGTCSAPACAVGETRCNNAQPQVCNTDRTGFTNKGALCASAALCNGIDATCSAAKCQAGDVTCSGAQPEICNPDLTGFQPNGALCATPALCDKTTGSCNTPACAAGETRCNGAQPQVCNTDRTGFQNSGMACTTAGLCNMNGTCTAPTCTPTQVRCNGAQPQVCNANQNGWSNVGTACATPALCNATTGMCDAAACSAGQTRCNGAQPQVCNSDQTNWMNMGTPCVTTALCNAATGTCTSPTCSPTDRRCNGAQPQVCNANQNGWSDSGMACASAGLCSGGMCSAAVCAKGDLHCNGAQPQTCNADLTGWTDTGMACASPPLCSMGTCMAPTCSATDHHCNGAVLQSCNATFDGWKDGPTCDSAALCNAMAGKCDTATCAAGDYHCSGAALQQCNTNLTGWDTTATCSSATLCDAAHHECDDCVAPAYRCTVTDTTNLLEQCDTTGHFAMLMDCGTNTCDATAGMCTPPPPPPSP